MTKAVQIIIALAIISTTATGCSFRAKERRIKWTEVPQKIQDSRQSNAPEVGRHLSPFSDAVAMRPEQDHDPREPIIVPARPIILMENANGRMIEVQQPSPVQQADERLIGRGTQAPRRR